MHLEKIASQQVNSKVHIIKSLVMQVDKVQSSNKQVNDEWLHHHSLGRALRVYNRTEIKRLKVNVKMRENVGEKREIDRGILGTFRDE